MTAKVTVQQLENDLNRNLTDTEKRYISWLHDMDK